MMPVARWPAASVFASLAALLFCTTPPAYAQARPKPQSHPPAHAAPTPARPPLDAEIKAALKAAPSPTEYPNDDYATLLDIGDVTVSADGTVTGVYREAYKVFNERGRRLADVSMDYTSSCQSLDLVYARTIRKNGTVVYVKPQDVQRTSLYSEYPLYDDSKAVKFSMPAVEDGCVIEYVHRQVTRPKVMAGQFGHYWSFAQYSPVLISRLRMTLPAATVPKYKTYNDDKLKPVVVTSADGAAKTYTWEETKIGTVEPEPAMPETKEFRPWMEVSSVPSWAAIGKWFREMQKPQAVSTPAIRAAVAKITAGCKDDDSKAKAIYDWVANKVRYVAVELGQSAYKPHKAGEVFEKLYGDCKDKANLLITMLAEAGIRADPVLVPANERMSLDGRLPAPHDFNHCIALAHVGGKQFWLDATADSCAYGDIPRADRGTSALVIADEGIELRPIPVYQAGESGSVATLTMKLGPDGSGDSEIVSDMTGMYGQMLRGAYRQMTPEQVTQTAEGIAQRLSPGSKLLSHKESDPKVNVDPFRFTLSAHSPSLATKSGDLLIVPLRSTASSSSGNPFVKEKRTWPIVLHDDITFHFVTTVQLPDGYEAMGIPSPAKASCAFLNYERTAVRSADGRSVVVTADCHYMPGRAPASDYAAIRACFETPGKADEEQIVLRKKQ